MKNRHSTGVPYFKPRFSTNDCFIDILSLLNTTIVGNQKCRSLYRKTSYKIYVSHTTERNS